MLTYVCDKCMTNRSDQGEMYHLAISKIERGKLSERLVNQIDICKPCYEKIMGSKK